MKLFRNIRRLKKIILFICLITIYFSCLILTIPFVILLPLKSNKYILVPLGNLGFKLVTKILGIKTTLSGKFTEEKGVFISLNHQSYLDYFVCNNITSGSFVSTVEFRNVFFFGFIAKLVGCVFIERRSRKNLENELQAVSNQLKNKVNIFIFPEAKATCGDEVIRFRRPFFRSAFENKTTIQLVTVNYQIAPKLKHDFIWHMNSPFLKHLWNVLAHKEIIVRCHGQILEYKDYASSNTENLADRCHQLVSQHFKSLKT